MKTWLKAVAVVVLLLAAAPFAINSQEAPRTKLLLQKDISNYASGDMLLSAGEVTLAPGAVGSKHRHPGPTFVYVLSGTIEAEFEGVPLRTYQAGDTIYENPRQLHISTRNPSKTEPARILVVHLSHKGEALTEPEK
ncbi:MAG TPA: cupin domain-containing protein [Candidatus Methylomirabilis sp.]|nr:cupin domain-containing protein [Candidatus Methylomirabilis sp.]